MKVQRCKGMRDMPPAEMAVFRHVEGVFRRCCAGWGYQEVRTPTIEHLHLFTSAGRLTPGMLGKVYSFLDWDGWSGERVVLRPDNTIPVARLYTENPAPLARYGYAANVFIFEETGEKTRERWQCGAELIGAGSPLADTELVALSLEVLQQLGLKDVELRLSHAGLVKSLLARLGLPPEEQGRMFDQILDGNVEALAAAGKAAPELEDVLVPLLTLKGQSPGFLRNLQALVAGDMPEIGVPLDDFLKMVALLEALGVKYQIDIASGAGFEYYTGMIFQLYAGGEKIGGGGRYDDLIPAMGGGEVPASGFALYLDRLTKLVKPGLEPGKTVVVRADADDAAAVKAAFGLADALRAAGYTAALDLNGGALAAGMIVEATGKGYNVRLEDRPAGVSAKNAEAVLALLEGSSGAEDSPA
jgi:histidyl-tRNA synthetase